MSSRVLAPPKRNKSVPVLLDSFPAPPSHIPTSPLSSPNPPPSLPPSFPLPPLPGPSPIHEHETRLFISSRSRRTSKVSVTSTSSSASSVASTAFHPGVIPPLTSPSAHTFGSARSRTGSTASASTLSIRSFSSSGSLSVPVLSYPPVSPHRRPSRRSSMNRDDVSVMGVSPENTISEEDSIDLTRMSLDDIPRATPSPMPHSDIELDDTPFPPSLTAPIESISSVDMRDLPVLQDDDDDDALVDFDLTAQALHFEMRAVRSKSSLHKSRIEQAAARMRKGSNASVRAVPSEAAPTSSSPSLRAPKSKAGCTCSPLLHGPYGPPPPMSFSRSYTFFRRLINPLVRELSFSRIH
ncbi:hypothetical protein EW146_g1667 [Bondarzewia mesenterica]|uniref:Uncharacterized protein n=1 Tax=Bondarzewia mesenterica TaxID=1095465 RepID=A0A4S4M9B3_9AGAM|nr:hypothetical protein EW146_g1667 [Bondarzewia mesenterica]